MRELSIENTKDPNENRKILYSSRMEKMHIIG